MKIRAELAPGKTALVTGGSSGIGKAIACLLVERGMHVWLLAQRKDMLEASRLEAESHRKHQQQLIATVSADISDWDQVRKAVQFVSDKSGAPNLLVNSAGVTHPGYLQQLDLDIFTWMMEVNYFGTVFVTKELLPAMLKRGSGYIINISSIAGFLGTFGYSAYGGSKFAVRGFSDVLRAEMKIHNIGVSVVFPPDTQTPQLEYESSIKPPETKALSGNTKVMSAEAVAAEIIKGIEHGVYTILPGFESKLIYRINNLAGGLLTYYMDREIAKASKQTNKSETQEA
jgi:3-dehydrosphinganine reductase